MGQEPAGPSQGPSRGAWGRVDWASQPCDPGMVVATPHRSLTGPQYLVYRWPVGVGPLQGEQAGMPSCGCPRPQSHPKDWADRWAGTGDPKPLGPSHTLAFNLPAPREWGHTLSGGHTEAGRGGCVSEGTAAPRLSSRRVQNMLALKTNPENNVEPSSTSLAPCGPPPS